MKNLAILTLVMSFNSFAGIAIISDLDDTIKITNVEDTDSAVARGILSRNTFVGMMDFFDVVREYSQELHILTASPPIISKSVVATLDINSIKYDSVAYKNPLEFEGKIPYKVRKIREIMDNSSHDFILIGDDVDKDPEVFEEVKNLYSDRILAAYVHVVRNREIPEGLTPYWTAADLALREVEAGRLSLISSHNVLDSMLEESRLEYTIPDYAHCPTTASQWEWQQSTPLAEKALRVNEALIQHCRDRESGSKPRNRDFGSFYWMYL